MVLLFGLLFVPPEVAGLDLIGLDGGVAFAAEDAATEAAAQADVASPYQPAPQLTEKDYPTFLGFNGRIFVWIAAQLHLWFAAFVLAVPIFVFIIEAIGMKTRDKRYDDMAYEFIKVSLTAYSLTAIVGGLTLLGLLVFYPHVMTYMTSIFKESMIFSSF